MKMNRTLQKLVRSLIAAVGTLALFVTFTGPVRSSTETEYEQLLVFVQSGDLPVDNVFRNQRLPEISQLAESMGVSLHVIDIATSAPAEVALTPLIVYQNSRGRSVYQGRTTTIDRIRNFIRTSRYVPQGSESNRRKNISLWQQGRTRMWAPQKVAAVTGSAPNGYDNDRFIAKAKKNINKGFKHFRTKKSADLGRADRGFYMDYYPWLSEDGTLFLSLALFSQFHCKEAIYTEKITGPWKNRWKLFRQGARMMEEAVARQVADPQNGDSFHPVPAGLATGSWESIDFPLPPAPPQKLALSAASTKLPDDWNLDRPGPVDPPMVIFRFPAPLDNYAGEVTTARGELQLPHNPRLDDARGFVEVDTGSAITMGNPMLDEAIRGTIMLSSKTHPTSRFEVESISGDGRPIEYGILSPAVLNGTFILKGKRKKLAAKGELEPIVGEDGLPRLLVRAAFQIDLLEFEIEGADGPAPARNTVLFDINIKFKGNSKK